MTDEIKLDISKPVWQSKTLWANLILASAAFYPPANDWINNHGIVFSLGLSILNIGLRSISSKKLDWGGNAD